MSELKAADLRIGNWIETYIGFYDGEKLRTPTVSQKQLTIEDLTIIAKSDIFHTYRGIPLSEDILLKAGFTHHARSVDLGMSGYFPKEFWYILEGMDEFNQRIFKHDFQLGQFRDGFYYQINYRKKGIKIESLHQLMNLYHSLTGIELEINL